MRIVRLGVPIVMLMIAVGTRLGAQSTKVELSGLVTDPDGLAVAGAEIRLLNRSTDAEFSISSLGGPTIARQQLLRPFPRFTTVAFYRNNVGHSTYHSLQSRLERRFAGGLTLSAAYTFSKLIDDAGAVFDAAILTGPAAVFQAADSYNRRLEKDESTGSIPHVFSGSYVWELPLVPAAGGIWKGGRMPWPEVGNWPPCFACNRAARLQ